MTKQLVWSLNSLVPTEPGSYRQAIGQVFGSLTFPVDRFGLFNDCVDCVNIVPAPVYNLINISNDWTDRYFSICDQIAESVYTTAGNRTIVLLYSGGVDSTVALVALMKNPRYQEFLDRGQLLVALTSLSIQEYPEFFYQRILPEIPIVPADYNHIVKNPDYLVVTGDGGDFVIGNTDTPAFSHDELDDYLRVINPDGSFKSLLEKIAQRAPFDINSVTQLYWWFGQCFFNQKDMCYPYVWSSVDDLLELSGFNRIYRFFFAPEFMTYSFEYMSTDPEYNNVRDLRTFPKNYIVNYTGHASYLDKTKAMSQRSTIRKFHKSVIYSDWSFERLI